MKTIPSGMAVYKRTAEFAKDTVPAALLREHCIADDVWAKLVVRKRPTNPSRAPAAEAGGQGGRLPWKCGTVGGEYWGLPVALAVAAAP
jgi:hypothetical protein